jgi:hypothetical protein
MKEVWKEIPEYDEYEVSNNGNIRKNKLKIIKSFTYKLGYLGVTLFRDKKRKIFLVHRIVALTFIGEIHKGIQVNHKNGIKADNRIENLELCTASENQKHSYRVLKRSRHIGENHPVSILTNENVYKIKYLENGSQRKIAEKYGISQTQVGAIKLNKQWKHI